MESPPPPPSKCGEKTHTRVEVNELLEQASASEVTAAVTAATSLEGWQQADPFTLVANLFGLDSSRSELFVRLENVLIALGMIIGVVCYKEGQNNVYNTINSCLESLYTNLIGLKRDNPRCRLMANVKSGVGEVGKGSGVREVKGSEGKRSQRKGRKEKLVLSDSK
ncbi:hypothetical protein M0802_002346 [Mischocyttarus mexicanus]|nr:hypothetical protein M0802_002346 [Mischocyttarus mexicanus]